MELDGPPGLTANADMTSREGNVMRQAANLHDLQIGMLLPGITINTTQSDFAPIKQMKNATVQRSDLVTVWPDLEWRTHWRLNAFVG